MDVETDVLLDQVFGAATLHVLREAVLAHACAAGMPEERAVDVMLTVHELAANAVCHGAGSGRLRMEVTAGTLRCQVSDPGPAGPPGSAAPTAPAGSARPAELNGRAAAHATAWAPWPVQPGRGLWVAQNAADRISMTAGPGGSVVTAVFDL